MKQKQKQKISDMEQESLGWRDTGSSSVIWQWINLKDDKTGHF